MNGYSSFQTYFDEDILPSGQAPFLTESVEKVRLMVDFLLGAKPKTGYGMMGVITGPSGVGKSVATQIVLNDILSAARGGLPPCLKIKAKPGSSPRQLVADLQKGFGEKLPRLGTNVFQIVDQAAAFTYNNDLRLLVIDNAEQLNAVCYDFLCFHFDKTGCATLVVGLPPIVQVIKQHEKFEGRVRQQLDFAGPSEGEVLDKILPNLTIPHWTFDSRSEVDRSLGKALWTSVKPSFRNLQQDKRITRDLVVQGLRMALIQRRPGGLETQEQEQEAPPDSQTPYEDESVARQKAKGKKAEDG